MMKIDAQNTNPIVFCLAAIIPEFQEGLKKAHVVEGRNARFECEVTGTPRPDVSWYVEYYCCKNPKNWDTLIWATSPENLPLRVCEQVWLKLACTATETS